jgi:hypothetical protein
MEGARVIVLEIDDHLRERYYPEHLSRLGHEVVFRSGTMDADTWVRMQEFRAAGGEADVAFIDLYKNPQLLEDHQTEIAVGIVRDIFPNAKVVVAKSTKEPPAEVDEIDKTDTAALPVYIENL